ncbi:unnamed protein product [Dimorphilus gyrociliatus]|uniref:Uncharacterized protein n=1 Tax=Dimorphilus gyrociliatus TaxID=2664684 RepID=A0A7I8V9H8_9ANNE|nr:unnamed protein product [Dimorphilus gyrociliatus]
MLDENDYIKKNLKLLLSNTEKAYSTLGRLSLTKDIVKNVNRLSEYRSIIQTESEIFSQISIVKPVFILTLPRTGSTFLHCLLSEDKRWKVPGKWELGKPYPYPLDPPSKENEETLASFKESNFLLSQFYGPQNIGIAHKLQPTDSEDILTYMRGDGIFSSQSFALDIPEYNACVENLSYNTWLKIFENFKDRLKMISRFQNLENRRFLLMFHMSPFCNISALLETFPDAQFIILHRDPIKIIPSITSLFQYTSRIHLKPFTDNTQYICDKLTDVYLKEIDKMFIWREDKRLKKNKIIDLQFSELVKNPKNVVKQLYRFLQIEYNQECDEAFENYIKFQNNHKYGVHKYMKMNLDKVKIRRRSKEYMRLYNIEPNV